MAKNEEKVMQFVERELEKNPGIATSELFELAKKADSGVASLNLRQFNARYPLQIKRRQSLAAPASRRRKAAGRKAAPRKAAPRKAAPRKAASAPAAAPKRGGRGRKADFRGQVREVFLKFAVELTAAEDRKSLVRVLSKVDGYVDDTLKAAGR